MKCPYCGNEMEKGEIQVGDAISTLFKGGHVIWLPEKERKKLLPKGTVNLSGIAEGYYCNQCVKVIGIFDERDTDFFQ